MGRKSSARHGCVIKSHLQRACKDCVISNLASANWSLTAAQVASLTGPVKLSDTTATEEPLRLPVPKAEG